MNRIMARARRSLESASRQRARRNRASMRAARRIGGAGSTGG